MDQETTRSQQVSDQRSQRHLAGERPRRDNRSHPFRVLPLAIGAVVLSVATAAAASELLWDLSGERYAEDVIKQAL